MRPLSELIGWPSYIHQLKRQSQQKSSVFLICWNLQEASMTNSVDPGETASIIWVHTVRFYT